MIFMDFYEFYEFLINFMDFGEFQNRRNFWLWCPQTPILEPMESPDSQLSIGSRISVWGHHHRNLWKIRNPGLRFARNFWWWKLQKIAVCSRAFWMKIMTLIVIFKDFPKSETRIWGRHHQKLRWWYPNSMILVPMESWTIQGWKFGSKITKIMNIRFENS